MEKADTVKEAKQALENCHRHGIMVIGGLIFGLPDDDKEAIRKKLSVSKRTGGGRILLSDADALSQDEAQRISDR
jgi:radical SAM superfamily enzyme